MNPLAIIDELIFLGLFGATLVGYVRRRDALSRDVMLIFASLAGIYLFAGIGAAAGGLPDPVIGLAFASLLAQPLFTLRLANRLWPVADWVRIGATAVWGVTSALMIVFPLEEAPLLVLVAIVAFVVIHLVAAAYLLREARRRVGSARFRLASAASAGAIMAAALFTTTILSAVPAIAATATAVAGGMALIAALLYIAAFLPPPRVRRIGSALTAFQFTQHLLDGTGDEDASAVWSRLADLSRRTTGAVVTLVAIGEPPAIVARSMGSEAHAERARSASLDAIPHSVNDQRPLSAADGELGRLAVALGAPYASVLPVGLVSGEPGVLVLLRARPSLFAADDHAILDALIGRARVFAERSAAISQQAALTQRLSATVAALEQAGQAKSDFLASMSHELRTPLSAIIGFSALMRDEPVTDGRHAIPGEWIEHVRRSGDHLLSLINDVLDLTKIEAGRIELAREPFELASALAESVEGLRPLADRKSITMTLDAQQGHISADRGRLRQVVYNLLSNAIKFTPDGGRVTIEGRWTGADASIVVTDSGVGIAEADLPHIFEEFRQVGDMKAREAGTGLGLALTRRLVEAHGGRVVVTSRSGAWSRFEVLLPESRVEPVELSQESGPASSAASGATVLLIEDDPSAVRLLRTYLETEGYRVETAADGEAGLKAARKLQPNAIILDVLLPGIDGWEVLRRLKADATLRDVPVMVATVVDERNVAMSLGAVDYFLKPVRPDALLARLATYTFTTKVKERSVRVLVIDDEAAARDLVVNALRPEGFEVDTAASGAEALAMVRERPPDLVICDLVMPDMDGFEVVDRLATSPMPKDVPILILTGQDLSAEDRRRLNGRVAEVMQKNGDPRLPLGRWLRRAAAASERRIA